MKKLLKNYQDELTPLQKAIRQKQKEMKVASSKDSLDRSVIDAARKKASQEKPSGTYEMKWQDGLKTMPHLKSDSAKMETLPHKGNKAWQDELTPLKKYEKGTASIVKKQPMMSEEEQMVDPIQPGESNNQRGKRMSAEADDLKKTMIDAPIKVVTPAKMSYEDAAAKIKSDKKLLAEFKAKKAETPKGKEFTMTIGGKTFRYAGVADAPAKAEGKIKNEAEMKVQEQDAGAAERWGKEEGRVRSYGSGGDNTSNVFRGHPKGTTLRGKLEVEDRDLVADARASRIETAPKRLKNSPQISIKIDDSKEALAKTIKKPKA
jgi:hypothetical protein